MCGRFATSATDVTFVGGVAIGVNSHVHDVTCFVSECDVALAALVAHGRTSSRGAMPAYVEGQRDQRGHVLLADMALKVRHLAGLVIEDVIESRLILLDMGAIMGGEVPPLGELLETDGAAEVGGGTVPVHVRDVPAQVLSGARADLTVEQRGVLDGCQRMLSHVVAQVAVETERLQKQKQSNLHNTQLSLDNLQGSKNEMRLV